MTSTTSGGAWSRTSSESRFGHEFKRQDKGKNAPAHPGCRDGLEEAGGAAAVVESTTSSCGFSGGSVKRTTGSGLLASIACTRRLRRRRRASWTRWQRPRRKVATGLHGGAPACFG